ncbi:MAG: hypothetical protein R2820_02380 [Cyclobacteriaceae bacterium]
MKQIVILLSSKCSGSSAFQRYLVENYGFDTIPNSGHWESETLYWTKVASVLKLPQMSMHRSQVPYSQSRALKRLRSFFKAQGVRFDSDEPTKEMMFELFFQLTETVNCPLIIEKSPHHIFNPTNIELIMQFREYIKERASVVVLGLVRNPLDTVYSAWKRWRFNCKAFEKEWQKSYFNLKKLMEANASIEFFKYEALSESTQSLDGFLENVIGVPKKCDCYTLNTSSVAKWRRDPEFMHHLESQTVQLGQFYGYAEQEMYNIHQEKPYWKMKEKNNSARYWLIAARRAVSRKFL